MFRAGVKAGLWGAGIVALVQLLSFFLSLLPGSLSLAFGSAFLAVTLLTMVGIGVWAGQLLGRPTVGCGVGAGALAGLIVGLAQGLVLALSVILAITLLHLTGKLAATLGPDAMQALQELGQDPYRATLVLLTTVILPFGMSALGVLGALLGAGGGAMYALIARRAPLPAGGDAEDEVAYVELP